MEPARKQETILIPALLAASTCALLRARNMGAIKAIGTAAIVGLGARIGAHHGYRLCTLDGQTLGVGLLSTAVVYAICRNRGMGIFKSVALSLPASFGSISLTIALIEGLCCDEDVVPQAGDGAPPLRIDEEALADLPPHEKLNELTKSSIKGKEALEIWEAAEDPHALLAQLEVRAVAKMATLGTPFLQRLEIDQLTHHQCTLILDNVEPHHLEPVYVSFGYKGSLSQELYDALYDAFVLQASDEELLERIPNDLARVAHRKSAMTKLFEKRWFNRYGYEAIFPHVDLDTLSIERLADIAFGYQFVIKESRASAEEAFRRKANDAQLTEWMLKKPDFFKRFLQVDRPRAISIIAPGDTPLSRWLTAYLDNYISVSLRAPSFMGSDCFAKYKKAGGVATAKEPLSNGIQWGGNPLGLVRGRRFAPYFVVLRGGQEAGTIGFDDERTLVLAKGDRLDVVEPAPVVLYSNLTPLQRRFFGRDEADEALPYLGA